MRHGFGRRGGVLADVGFDRLDNAVLVLPVVAEAHVFGHNLVVVDAARAPDNAFLRLVAAGAIQALYANDNALLVGHELDNLLLRMTLYETACPVCPSPCKWILNRPEGR